MFRYAVLLAPVFFIVPALAERDSGGDFYMSGSFGVNDQKDSANDGRFSSDFTTGTVTGVNPPLTIPTGESVGWLTEFDSGETWSLAFGWHLDAFRLELEYANADANISNHVGVNAAGIDLTNIDAGVLISGNTGDLGVSVGDLVSAAQGEIDSSTLYVNALYDFDTGTALTPYIGVGLGYSRVDVTYIPSGVEVINGDDDVMVYQLIGGLSYKISDAMDLYGNVRYRNGGDVEVTSSLLSTNFEIENESLVFDLGLRYSF